MYICIVLLIILVTGIAQKSSQLRCKAVRTSAIQLQYNCNIRIFCCIAVALHLCGLLQYNKIFVLFYCSCIVVVLHLCGPI